MDRLGSQVPDNRPNLKQCHFSFRTEPFAHNGVWRRKYVKFYSGNSQWVRRTITAKARRSV